MLMYVGEFDEASQKSKAFVGGKSAGDNPKPREHSGHTSVDVIVQSGELHTWETTVYGVEQQVESDTKYDCQPWFIDAL